MTESELRRAALNKKAEYYRAWRAKNRDKVKATNERYWLKRALRELEEGGQNGTGKNENDR
jgi:hypothetical protein